MLRDSEGQGSLEGWSPWGLQRVRYDWTTSGIFQWLSLSKVGTQLMPMKLEGPVNDSCPSVAALLLYPRPHPPERLFAQAPKICRERWHSPHLAQDTQLGPPGSLGLSCRDPLPSSVLCPHLQRSHCIFSRKMFTNSAPGCSGCSCFCSETHLAERGIVFLQQSAWLFTRPQDEPHTWPSWEKTLRRWVCTWHHDLPDSWQWFSLFGLPSCPESFPGEQAPVIPYSQAASSESDGGQGAK